MVRAAGRSPTSLVLAVAHSKGGVGKTTTTLILGRYLARRWRVALLDYDESAHLTDLVSEMAPDQHSLTRRLWLRNGEERVADITLIDSAPSRSPETRRALVEADFVLIPAPPERMAVRAMQQMIDTVESVRATDNPYLQILGVVPTMYDRAWPDHNAYMEQMQDACAQRQVRLFPPVVRRHSYLSLSTAGQDYRPVADAVSDAIARNVMAGA
jgi:cellulose biosynthesis protein BcsQ